MNADDIQRLVHDSIGDMWNATNDHSVDLRKALVPPRRIKLIERLVRAGQVRDTVIDAWLANAVAAVRTILLAIIFHLQDTSIVSR